MPDESIVSCSRLYFAAVDHGHGVAGLIIGIGSDVLRLHDHVHALNHLPVRAGCRNLEC